jgi:DNA-binding protein H-NS
MTTLKELKERRAALDAEIARLQSSARSDAIAQVKDLMAQFDLSLSDLEGTAKAKRKAGAVPAKYRDPSSGNTWSGRGLQPKWLRAAIESGATLESFKI